MSDDGKGDKKSKDGKKEGKKEGKKKPEKVVFKTYYEAGPDSGRFTGGPPDSPHVPHQVLRIESKASSAEVKRAWVLRHSIDRQAPDPLRHSDIDVRHSYGTPISNKVQAETLKPPMCGLS